MKIIGYDSDSAYEESGFKQKVNKSRPYFKNGMKCCYCEDLLTIDTCTREHIIPKRLNGKITKPCCKTCNTQKAGLSLEDFISKLERIKKDINVKETGTIKRYNTKIKNAKTLLTQIQSQL